MQIDLVFVQICNPTKCTSSEQRNLIKILKFPRKKQWTKDFQKFPSQALDFIWIHQKLDFTFPKQ